MHWKLRNATAWNRRHAEAIAAAFAEGGTYSDPTGGWVFMESPLPTM